MTEQAKVQWLRQRYESSLARSAFFSFQAFYEAVQQEVLSISGVTGNLADPESPDLPLDQPEHAAESLPALRRSNRDLKPLLNEVVQRGRVLLEPETDNYVELLHRDYLPRIDWTRRPVRSTLAYWTTRLSGRARGQVEIRVNKWLQAPKTQISDELLEYLIWHELLPPPPPGAGPRRRVPTARVLVAGLRAARPRAGHALREVRAAELNSRQPVLRQAQSDKRGV